MVTSALGRFCPVSILALCCLLSLGCGSSNSNGGGSQGGSLAVNFTSPSTAPAIDQGQSVTIKVTVSNDAAGKGVTWSLRSGAGKGVGTLSNETSNGATFGVTYAAPAAVTHQVSVTIVAQSISDPTVSASLGIVISPPPVITGANPIQPTVCPTPGSIVPVGGSTAGVGTQYFATFSATGGTAPYSWSFAAPSVLSNGLLLQSLGLSQSSISGIPLSAGCQVLSLQLTDAAGVTSAPFPFALLTVPASLSSQIPILPSALVTSDSPQVGLPYAAALRASGGVGAYSWTVAFGTPPPGLSLDGTGLLSGTPSPDGLFVNGGLGTYSFSAIVNDSQSPYPATKIVGMGIGVNAVDESCHSGLESNLKSQGSYAFSLRGFDKDGPVAIAGSFTVDGAGNITGGVEDINRTRGAETNISIEPTGSSYQIGSDNRGCVTLATSHTTTTFRTGLSGCSTSLNLQAGGCLPDSNSNPGYFTSGHLIEFDDASGSGATGSGIIRLQDSSAFAGGLNGMYALGLDGWDSDGGRYALAGSTSASGGNLSSIAADTNDAGTVATLTGGSGTYNVDPSGRGTATLTVGSTTFDLALYLVSKSEAILVSTDTPSAAHPIVSGRAIGTKAPFSPKSLPNSYILHMAGVAGGVPDPNLGLLTFDGIGAFSGTVFENRGGTLGTSAVSGAYFVSGTTGRVELSAPLLTQNLGPHPFVAYVVPTTSGIAGFVVGTDASAQAGALEFLALNPPAANFSAANVVGRYSFGTEEPLDPSTSNLTGVVRASGAGVQGGFWDISSSVSNGLTPNQGFGGSYAVSGNGSGNFGGETVSVTNGKVLYYIDESPLNKHPSITVVER